MQAAARTSQPAGPLLTRKAGPRRAVVKVSAAPRRDSMSGPIAKGSEEEHDLDVAIVGGGPGGLAAAAAILAAKPGLRVGVFERSTLRPRGAVLNVQPNGMRALHAISPDLAQAVAGIDSKPTVRRHFADDGSLLSMKSDDGPLEYVRQKGGPFIMCAWHRLQAVLADSLPAGVLHQECPFDTFAAAPSSSLNGGQHQQGEDGGSAAAAGGVTVRFKPGTRPPVTARVLVGADGGQSAVRAQLLGDGQPSYADTGIWRAVVPRPDWWYEEPGAYAVYGLPPRMMLAFSLPDGTVAWQAFAPWPVDRLAEIGGRGTAYTQDPVARREQGEARRNRALEAFASSCPEAGALINAADLLAVTEHGQFFREPDACKVWASGRVALLGDAAHLSTPFLAQGTSQAFEDALALGRAIGEYGPTAEALQAYQAFRAPQMHPIHTESLRMFRDFKAGGMPPQEHLQNEKLGVWKREMLPLRPATAAGIPA